MEKGSLTRSKMRVMRKKIIRNYSVSGVNSDCKSDVASIHII